MLTFYDSDLTATTSVFIFASNTTNFRHRRARAGTARKNPHAGGLLLLLWVVFAQRKNSAAPSSLKLPHPQYYNSYAVSIKNQQPVAMSVVQLLRQNNPARTRIRIILGDETSDADLAQALEQNPFVTEMELVLYCVHERADWDSLLRVIATRANLAKVSLQDAYFADQRNAPAMLVRLILRAIQQNTSVRSIELAVATSPHRYILHLWTPHLQSHRSVFMAVTWKPPSGNKEHEILLQRCSATQTSKV